MSWALTLTSAALLCAAPAWLMRDMLDYYRLLGDDFVYVAGSRSWAALKGHLWEPHNAHVVPVFRLWTYALVRAAGRLAGLPPWLGRASYLALVLALLAIGYLVARESGRVALGLGAMALLGLSTVLEPSVAWYSASQTIWAGVAILAMLIALQGWRAKGSAWRLALAALAAAASPLCWAGGFVAGPVGSAYLLADGRRRCLQAAIVPLAVSVLTALIVWSLAGRAGAVAASPSREPLHLVLGFIYTTQAIPEVLIGRNFGLVVTSTFPQALVLCLALVFAWAWSRGYPWRPHPLEAAGAVLVVSAFLMAYAARADNPITTMSGLGWGEVLDYLPYEGLRPLAWYHTLPQIGAVLFALGWWSGRAGALSPESLPLRRPTRCELLAVAGLSALLVTLHLSRARTILLKSVPPSSPAERLRFPIPELQRLRAVYLAESEAARQRRFLAQLDRVEQVCARRGIGRDAVRRAFGRVVGPGFPERLASFDALDVLDLPARGLLEDPDQVRLALGRLLMVEPEIRPPWLLPAEPWPARQDDG